MSEPPSPKLPVSKAPVIQELRDQRIFSPTNEKVEFKLIKIPMEQSQKQVQSMYQPLIEKLREDNPPLPLWPKSFNL